MAGTLYLVTTPIGNLEDITLRAIRVLSEADLVAAEDTRLGGRLLRHLQIKKPLISYYEHNKQLRGEMLIAELRAGKKIALISDAGTPCLSDPGADLVRAALAEGIEVIAIPGASALLTALTVSGLDNGPFCFEGFLARDKATRRKRLQALMRETRVMVFYEAPHRLRATLDDMAAAFGPERKIAVCRELTKLYEEKLRGSIGEMQALFAEREPRGEFTLVVAGYTPPQIAVEIDWAALTAALERLLAQGMPRKQAARELAAAYGLPVKSVYDLGLKADKN